MILLFISLYICMCLGTCTKVKEDIRCSLLSHSTLFPWDRVVSEHGDLLADGLCSPQHWGHRCPWPHLTLYVGARDIRKFPMLVRPACSLTKSSLQSLFWFSSIKSVGGGDIFFSFVISSVILILQSKAVELTWILLFYCSNTEVSKSISVGCGHLGVAHGLAGYGSQLCAAGLPGDWKFDGTYGFW